MTLPLRHFRCSSRTFRHGPAQARHGFTARLKTTGGLLILLSGLCGLGNLASVVPVQTVLAQQMSDRIAAIINTEVIMLSELEAAMADEIVRLKARYDGEAFEAHLLQKQYAVLNRMIERKLQLQEAAAKNITVSDKEVDSAWEQVQQNPDAYPPELSRSKDIFREEMVLRRLSDLEVQQSILVPFEEIRAYYQERVQDFDAPQEHHLHQILVKPKSDENTETVKERAEGLERQLQDGTPFEKLASIYSDGPAKDQGGDLEFVRQDDLLEPLGTALDKIAPGEHSPVIETNIGMHILLRGETREGATQSFDDVKDIVEQQLYQKKLREAYGAWLSTLKDKSYINILL